MELTISFSTLVKAGLGFLGVYILMPMALIVRDHLIILYVERLILTEEFWMDVKILTIDKAYYNTIYTKKYEFKVGANGVNEYFIDEVKVSKEAFSAYLEKQKFYTGRIEILEPKVLSKTNLLKGIDKYFKLNANFLKIVDDTIEFTYDLQVRELKNMQKDVIVTDVSSI